MKKSTRDDAALLSLVKLAVLGDSATPFLCQAIQTCGEKEGLRVELYEGLYDQMDRDIFDGQSDLYKFQPQYAVFFHSVQKLRQKFWTLSYHEKLGFADAHIQSVKNLYETFSSKHLCKMIYFNFPELEDGIFGNYSNAVPTSFAYHIRTINLQLMKMAQKLSGFFICDVCSLSNRFGQEFAFDERLHVNADVVFSLDMTRWVAKNVIDMIQALAGKLKKCVILDLDNTIWGGEIGDEGIESIQVGHIGIGKAFSLFQWWLKQLKERGIMLAVCSKNDADLAKEPFEKHPEMILRLDDFVMFLANWNSKVENIKAIRDVLNIDFDSMIFIDDSPFERGLVRSQIPEITVPELPKDPADYIKFLGHLNLFETGSFVHEDELRTEHYQHEAKRVVARQHYSTDGEFLTDIKMICTISGFDAFNIPRVAQLTQRSNQFNFRTVRYAADELKAIASLPTHIPICFSLCDRFGDYGLVSVVILVRKSAALFIDTWVMSCRVLKRTLEDFILNELVEIARKESCAALVGEYLTTKKNGLVKNLFAELGFGKSKEADLWVLNVNDYQKQPTSIKHATS